MWMWRQRIRKENQQVYSLFCNQCPYLLIATQWSTLRCLNNELRAFLSDDPACGCGRANPVVPQFFEIVKDPGRQYAFLLIMRDDRNILRFDLWHVHSLRFERKTRSILVSLTVLGIEQLNRLVDGDPRESDKQTNRDDLQADEWQQCAENLTKTEVRRCDTLKIEGRRTERR